MSSPPPTPSPPPPLQSPPTAIPTQTPPLSNPPPIIQALSYSPLKKPQPIPWSHEETLNLIKAYQEKWYSLKRGQLKASQWEEVAITVAARCGLDVPSKSGTQCRHKIEKLRKRYRAEKTKLPPSFTYHNHHPWIYFSLMDHLERGPLPISAVAPSPSHLLHHHHHHQHQHQHQQQQLFLQNDDHDGDGDDNHDHDDGYDDDCDVGFSGFSKPTSGSSRNFDGLLRKRVQSEDFGNGYKRGGDFNGKKRKSFYGDVYDDEDDEHDNDDDVEEREMKNENKIMGELGAEIREFAERLVRIEGKKIELMRETENLRLEMENRRMEMIIGAQHKIVELISKAFNGGGASSTTTSTQKKVIVNSDF